MRAFMLLPFLSIAFAAPLYSTQPSGYGYTQQQPALDYYQQSQYLAPTTPALNIPYHIPTPYHQPQQQQHHHQQPAPIITKRFYIHSAPEEPDQEINEKFIQLGQPRKSYNIVFIRAPAAKPQRTLLKIQPTANEERTVIYVLSKKAAEQQIETHVYEPPMTTSKPEVFFIKYKTNDEASAAQQQIQSQYDQLGGSTEISHEQQAQVTSVIGSLDGGASQTNANAAYLPPTSNK